MVAKGNLPRIIWVAARPPVPPFSGIISKTLCGLDALSSMTDVALITFSNLSSMKEISSSLQDYWGKRHIHIHVTPIKPRKSWLHALTTRQFQQTTEFDFDAIAAKLAELRWMSHEQLVVFDDIVLAPFVQAFGANAILSPHDCMSEMFHSHFRALRPSTAKLRKYFQYRIARLYETRFYHAALLVHVITQRDRIWMEAINPFARYHVVPNADLLNPGLVRDFDSPWDILIWGDLTIAACALGVREFLLQARDNSRLVNAKIILIGKVSKSEAFQIIGREYMSQIEYASRLEDEDGCMRSAKIFVIPDIGGAGIKNRVVNVVSSGLCLACLMPQMEGVEELVDRGAINALNMRELAHRTAMVLELGDYERIAGVGHALYHRNYSLESNRHLWHVMIDRACSVRSNADISMFR